MKYFITTDAFDAQIKEIRSKIRLSMNGIVTEHMEKKGIHYKKNFGVSIPRIKEIALEYEKNHDLAQRLWCLQTRETMIIATLIEPIEKFSIENANEWSKSFNQIEIVEQTTMNLLCKLPFATVLSTDWIHSNDSWVRISGFILAARIRAKLDDEQLNFIINKAIELSISSEFHLYKSIATCLSFLCRTNKQTASYINENIDKFSNSDNISEQYIYSEVKNELLFLDIL